MTTSIRIGTTSIKNRITDSELEPVGSGSVPGGLLEMQNPRPHHTPTDLSIHADRSPGGSSLH